MHACYMLAAVFESNAKQLTCDAAAAYTVSREPEPDGHHLTAPPGPVWQRRPHR